MASTAQDIMRRYGIDQAFAASIESLGNDLGVDPMYLANTMYAESRLNTSIENEAGSGAMGLIQFMPETAKNLGTTTDELSRMTPVEQMEYVRKYFSADNLGAGRLRDLRNDPSQHNVNMAVFLPSMIGKPLDTQIPQKYWRQNGSIRTPGDYTRSAEKRVNEYIQSNPVDTQTDEMLSQEQPEDSFRPENDSVPSDTGTPTGDQNEEEPGFLDTVGKYASGAVDSMEQVIETVGDKLRRLLNLDEDIETDTPPLPVRKPDMSNDEESETPAPLPMRRPQQASTDETERAFSDVVSDVKSIPEKAEGGSVEKEVEFGKEDDDDVPDPPPGATPEEVADDIPAYLSTGEYVLPANVVRYIGLKNIADMHRMALAELQQMEDLDIIENVDENGYVEDDDDETEYMEPEGVVEVIVAEHHPKGLMSKGFAEGGPVEAMVYVPGVGFVPQTEAATQPVKTKEEDTPVSKLKESGEDTQADRAQQEEETEKISAEEAKSRAEKGYLGISPMGGLAAGVISAINAEQALSSAGVSRDQFGNTTFGPAQTGPLGTTVASSIAGLMSNPGVPDAVKDHMSTSLSDEQMSEVLDSIEAGFDTQAQQEAEVGLEAFGGPGAPVGGEAESESESESESGTGSEAAQGGGGADTAGLKKGGYVTKKGIMNRPY